MNNLIIRRSQLVKAVIIQGTPDLGDQVMFEDIPDISKGNIKLYGIEAYTEDQITTTPDGLTVISAADGANAVVTLVTTDHNYKQIENQPYNNFIRELNAGFINLLDNIQIDLTKCFVTITDPGAFATDQCFLFNLYFDFIDAEK